MNSADGSFPFHYGSDLHYWLWGWGDRLHALLWEDGGKPPDRNDSMVFRPDRLAADAMMKLSVSYPQVVRQIQDHLDYVELQWRRFAGDRFNPKAASAVEFVDAMQDLLDRIVAATETIAEAEKIADKTDESADWPKQAKVAEGLGTNKMDVHRLIERKELRTNGKLGHKCRVDPASILEYCEKTGTAYNDT